MTLFDKLNLTCVKHPTWLRVVDSSLGLLLFFPSMLVYWRGIWDLLGIYFLPNQGLFQFWMMIVVGSCAIFTYALLPVLNHYVSREQRVLYFIITRTLMYLHGLMAMFHWRGVWSLADHFLAPFGWITGLVGLIVCYGSLTLMMTSSSVIFTPFSVSIDTNDHILIANTCLQTEFVWGSKLSALKYALDSILTQYIIVTLTILTWRSQFTLLDAFIFPSSDGQFSLFSNVFCLCFGLSMSIILFSLESVLVSVARRIDSTKGQFARMLWEDLVHLVVFVNMSFLWRGAWNLNAKYMIEDQLIGGWVNHVIGTVLLISLQILQIVGSVGCVVDGSDDVTSRGGMYHTEYLRKIMRMQIIVQS